MENFIEYSLPYHLTFVDHLKRIFFSLLPMAAGVLMIMLLNFNLLAILFCFGMCFLSYRIFMSFNYELEYTLLENEITFTKIINKERRRELLKVDISKTESYGLLENQPAAANLKTRSFLTNGGEEPSYYWITENQAGEKLCVLFQPTDAVLNVFSVRARGKQR